MNTGRACGQSRKTIEAPPHAVSVFYGGHTESKRYRDFFPLIDPTIMNDGFRTMESVSLLSQPICPSYITDFIMSVIVYTIQRMCYVWAHSHLIKKLLKILKTKLDSPSAVAVIERVFRIIATSFGGYKDSIFLTTRHCMTEARFRLKATTGACFSRCQCVSFMFRDISTVTVGVPISVTPNTTSISKNGQSIKSHPLKINKFRMAWFGLGNDGRILVRHSLLLFSKLCLGLRESVTRFREPLLFYHTCSFNPKKTQGVLA